MLVDGEVTENLPLSDRAIHYGDGLFETILVRDGKAILWPQHMQRLEKGADTLKLRVDTDLIKTDAARLLAQHTGLGVLKIIISRGSGGRGYTPPDPSKPRRIVQLHALPKDYHSAKRGGISAQVCTHPVSFNPRLAGLKHLNRLDQVMASQELGPDIDEGLMFDPFGNLVEGIKSNVFIIETGTLVTPALDNSGVAGIMRDQLINQAKALEIPLAIENVSLERLQNASGAFVCNSVFGLWAITHLRVNGADIHYPQADIFHRLDQAIADILNS
ncbi:MAG: aminodeoxychorismate lyase [Pseudohongiellaceae bacterium]|nr:aminodeoxychorismate lyase [Pseudohongiellaceae bacterium]